MSGTSMWPSLSGPAESLRTDAEFLREAAARLDMKAKESEDDARRCREEAVERRVLADAYDAAAARLEETT